MVDFRRFSYSKQVERFSDDVGATDVEAANELGIPVEGIYHFDDFDDLDGFLFEDE